MKQVIARAGEVVVSEVPRPVCGDNGVLVRTAYSVISTGTETWTIDSTEPISAGGVVAGGKFSKAVKLSRQVLESEGVKGFQDYVDSVRHPEFPIGYSSSGVVVQVGKNVTDISLGDHVACAGEAKAVHAEIASVPRNLLTKIPQGLDMKEAAFATIGAIAMHAFRRSGAQLGEYVAVIGAGLVGNLVAQIASASGCRVASMDLREDRLKLIKDLGIEYTIRSNDPAVFEHLSDFTSGRGFDIVMVCAATASSEPINFAAKIARSKARIVIVGRVGMEIERKDYYQKELDLVMTRSLGPGRYDLTYEEKGVDYPLEYVRWTLNRNMSSFLEAVNAKRVNVSSLIGGEYEIDKAQEAYSALGAQSKTALVLKYDLSKEFKLEDSPPVYAKSSPRKVTGRVKAALVGPGNFAKETLMPILRTSPSFSPRWVVSSSPVHATQLAKRYSFEKSTCDYEEVLKDQDTDVVIVSAPNNLHAPMAISAMKAGKTVFVEKPLAIRREEFEEVKKVYGETKVPLAVGFNRRYSPLVLKMKERMDKMDGPFVVTFRCNAGFVPASRWSQDPEIGGGRIIAEACHFFDLFSFLLGQKGYPEISAVSAEVNGSSSVAMDNVSATLKYPDGSVATLIYTAMGPKDMDRERIEVFGQGASMVIDDFKKLQVFGSDPLTVSLRKQDKGWKAEFEELAKFMRGESSSLITFEECVLATEITFRVEEALRRAKDN